MDTQYCSARICAYAHDYGFSDQPTLDYYTIGFQCQDVASTNGLCDSHSACNKLPFGHFNKKVPDYALQDFTMENGDDIEKGEALCWAFPKPDIDDDCNLIHQDQKPLDDDYWCCENYDDYNDHDKTNGKSDNSPNLKVRELKQQLQDRNLPTNGKKKDLQIRLQDALLNDNPSTPVLDTKKLKVHELKQLLEDRKLPTIGKKKDLQFRLHFALIDEQQQADKQKKSDTQKTVGQQTSGSTKKKRQPSEYNLFMKNELPKFRKQFPNLDYKTCFAHVAKSWTDRNQNQ